MKLIRVDIFYMYFVIHFENLFSICKSESTLNKVVTTIIMAIAFFSAIRCLRFTFFRFAMMLLLGYLLILVVVIIAAL